MVQLQALLHLLQQALRREVEHLLQLAGRFEDARDPALAGGGGEGVQGLVRPRHLRRQ